MAALALPWFSSGESSWGLVWSSSCSEACRYELFARDVEWMLVPLFVMTRIVALVGAVALAVAAGLGWLDRLAPNVVSAVGALALLVFAIHFAAVPGDLQYEQLAPSFGALFAIAGAVAALLNDLPRRRSVLLPIAGALLVLGAALWLPWITEVEVLLPPNAQEQSARSYGTINDTYHWHGLRVSRRHYMEHALTLERLSALKRRDFVEHGPGYCAAIAGVILAASLLVRARDPAGEKGRAISLRAAGSLATCGVLMPFGVFWYRPVVPASGALCAAVVVVGVFVAEVWRRRELRRSSQGTALSGPTPSSVAQGRERNG